MILAGIGKIFFFVVGALVGFLAAKSGLIEKFRKTGKL